jgi:hypothetical protein
MMPTTPPVRPPSPWPGSRHEAEHRWQLDGIRSLAAAVEELHSLAGELRAAHIAGWSLVEPMRSGHLLATRSSRRQRARLPCGSAGIEKIERVPPVRWRVRLVDEPPVSGEEVLMLDRASRTVVLNRIQGSMRQASGPAIPPSLLAELTAQVSAAEVEHRLWGVAPARIGPNVDLVAVGSALRIHAIEDGALVRTAEALTFQHAADRAATLVDAAAAYELLAREAEAVITAGGRLVGVDDGLLEVWYDCA